MPIRGETPLYKICRINQGVYFAVLTKKPCKIGVFFLLGIVQIVFFEYMTNLL